MSDISILDDPQFKEFVRVKGYKQKSIKNHRNGLDFFCNFLVKHQQRLSERPLMNIKLMSGLRIEK